MAYNFIKEGNTMDYLAGKCVPCEGGTPPLTKKEIENGLAAVPRWEFADGKIRRSFSFKDHYETMAFVNAVAWISHSQGHHPDMTVGYNTCVVGYMTHAIGGLSNNDFFCAAKVNALLAG
jgi:4a-hydroxytetrahydrobiopterin dehydratase